MRLDDGDRTLGRRQDIHPPAAHTNRAKDEAWLTIAKVHLIFWYLSCLIA